MGLRLGMMQVILSLDFERRALCRIVSPAFGSSFALRTAEIEGSSLIGQINKDSLTRFSQGLAKPLI